MDTRYCGEKCPIGKEKRAEFLDKSDSIYGAVAAFWAFIDKCFETCPYKNKHTEEKK